MNSDGRASHGCALLLALSLLCAAANTRASIGVVTGDVAGEILPSAAAAHVVHEDLLIDLRPVEDGKPAHVVARYELRNDGPPLSFSLFMVGPADRQGSVRHNGRVLRASRERRSITAAQPAGEPEADTVAEPQLGLAFDVTLAHGDQTLEVEYLSRPDVDDLDLVARYSVNYEVAPARHWASYGTLSLRLQLPEGWEVLQTPAMSGATVGPDRTWSFRALPTSPVLLQAAPPKAPYIVLIAAQLATYAVALCAPLLAGWRLRRRAHRLQGRVSMRERLLSFVLCLSAVALLPLLTLPVDLYWLTHRSPNHAHMVETVATCAFGAILCLLGHLVFGWSPKRLT